MDREKKKMCHSVNYERYMGISKYKTVEMNKKYQAIRDSADRGCYTVLPKIDEFKKNSKKLPIIDFNDYVCKK